MIEQAIYGVQDGGDGGILAHSPGFLDAWRPAVERLAANFGERPEGVACPGCVFAQPFPDRQVVVVQAADQGGSDGRPGALAFRLLLVPARLYDRLGGDPFAIANRFPPDWKARGDLPSLEWTGEPPPARTVEEIQKVLNVPHSATLLGGVQALLDGGRLVFERTAPDAHVLRSLWALLPTASRRGLWPATFAFSNACRFHAVVVPRAEGPDFADYIDEERAGDYPAGRYELQLQTAVESGDQREMDALFARRSQRHMLHLVVGLLLFMMAASLASLWPGPPAAPKPGTAAAAADQPKLPAAEACPPLDGPQRRQLVERLQQLGRLRGVAVPADTTDAALTDGIEKIDAALGPGEAGRDPGRLHDLGPVQRQLRALLWKHGVADYDAPGLEPAQVVVRLQDKMGLK
ncbi:MAG TPA: hypothetical protein VMS17_20705 [Gemmataceae bacterium]|nr:hypothetical protein [Gemmataceae bacterium]